MNITNMPQEKLITKEGDIHPSWKICFNQMINQLQTFLSDERYKLPQQETTNVEKLNNENNVGGILYDKTSHQGKINNKGKYKILGTYEQLTSDEVNNIPSGERNGRLIFETDTMNTKLGTNDTFINL